MKTNSETTWMPAAKNGLRKPRKAKDMPIPSTVAVPKRFTIIVL